MPPCACLHVQGNSARKNGSTLTGPCVLTSQSTDSNILPSSSKGRLLMEAQFFFWLHIEGQMTIVREDRGQQGKRTIGHSHNRIRHWSRLLTICLAFRLSGGGGGGGCSLLSIEQWNTPDDLMMWPSLRLCGTSIQCSPFSDPLRIHCGRTFGNPRVPQRCQ